MGSSKVLKTDVRVVAATNLNVAQAINKGKFREDLFYRLNVFPLTVPPLRERKTDIPLLIDHFVEKYSERSGHKVVRISTPAIDMLMAYHWPGNVRELRNVIERAGILARGDVVLPEHLPERIRQPEAAGGQPHLLRPLEETEKLAILEALRKCRGNRTHAARLLGISRRTLQTKIKKYAQVPV